MSLRPIYDPSGAIKGWFDPVLTVEGWFDQELTATSGPATIDAVLKATDTSLYVTEGYVAYGYVSAPSDVAAFSMTLVHGGSLAATDAKDTASFSATLVHTAALAAVEAKDVAAFSGVLVHIANLSATDSKDVASFDATVISNAPAEPEVAVSAPAGKPTRHVRRRYIMPDGRVFLATTDEVIALLQLYAVPKEAIEQLTAPPAKAITVRAPQITLQKRDVRFVPAEQPDTYRAVISERFVYRAPPEVSRQAEISANRMRDDEEAIVALLM